MIRPAVRGDEFAIMELIHGLAEFENSPHEVKNTPEKLAKDLFDDNICDAFVYEVENKVIGFSLYYISYSTWRGPCLYLEDLYVDPDHRGKQIGEKLFTNLVELAKSRGYARMDWQVLDWNKDAIRFYERQGATIDTDWYNGRMFFD